MVQLQIEDDVRRRNLTRALTSGTKRLMVFLTPGYELRAGGVLSIAWIYEQSVAMQDLHRANVGLCVVPGDPLLPKYNWFENSNYLLDLDSVLESCSDLDHFLLHIPEYVVNRVLDWLESGSSTLLRNINEVHFNVMIHNIDLLQGQDVKGLSRFGKVTCTTGHEAYSNLTTREAVGVPLHRLLVFIGPALFPVSGYRDKDPLLIVSHDEHPLKEQVLELLAQALPELTIQIIKELHYDEYKKLIRRARWSMTFGEGLDGYFVEPIWSGGISFAVFNDRFFTPPFANLETVYPSWEALMERMPDDLSRLDEPVAYNQYWRREYDLVGDLHSTDRFLENLRLFYTGEYTFP